MGTIIPIHGDPHETAQHLLPWYLTDTLEPAERALVEAHLADCTECRAELESERRLHALVADAEAPVAADWQALRARTAEAATRPARPGLRWLPLMAACQILVFLAGFAAHGWLRTPVPEYHALSTARPVSTGNAIVIFKPDVPEQAFRAALNGIGARLVDGPTAAGAYVLAVPGARRDAALGSLRARQDVILAQPIDGE